MSGPSFPRSPRFPRALLFAAVFAFSFFVWLGAGLGLLAGLILTGRAG